MSQTTAHRISLGGAIVVLLLTIYSLFQPPMVVCGDLAKNYAPVIAFELARSISDLHAIFGDAPSACRTALAARMDFLTWADCLVFIPAYGVFLLFYFFAMAPRDERSGLVGFVVAAVALVADYLENICLFRLVADPDTASIWLSFLPYATGLKWLCLGLAGAIGGTILIQTGRVNYPAAAACALSFLATVLAIANPHLFGAYVSNGVALSWVVFLIVDIRQSLLGSAVAEFEVQNGG